VSEPSEHRDEYHDAMIDMLELIWGQGFLIPAGPENARRIVAGLELRDKLVLDIGSGIGGPALILAGEMGARVVGIDLEGPLVARAQAYGEAAGLGERVEFRQVTVGPLAFDDESIDVVYSSGAFTQVEDKLGMFQEVFRVLKPGGIFTCYDWMKGDEPYSEDMRSWFELEGLTYAMETLDAHGRILQDAGFTDIELKDDQQAYRDLCHRELDEMQGPLKAQMIEMLGREQQEHSLENWRAMVVVLDKGELRPGFYRGTKPA
jgi:phosphoethanolamine N-methyltransferase